MRKVIVLLMILFLAACEPSMITGDTGELGSEKETESAILELKTEEIEKTEEKLKTDGPVELSFGASFDFDGFRIELGQDYSFVRLDNELSDYRGEEVIVIPSSLTNISGNTQSLNRSSVTIFDQSGITAANLDNFFEDSIQATGQIKDGQTFKGYFYILYTGDGDYLILFSTINQEVEVRLPIER